MGSFKGSTERGPTGRGRGPLGDETEYSSVSSRRKKKLVNVHKAQTEESESYYRHST